MQDACLREMSHRSFRFTVVEGQPCFGDCPGHFKWWCPSATSKADDGAIHDFVIGCSELVCDVCRLDAKSAEAVAAAAIEKYFAERMDLQAALEVVNNYKTNIKDRMASTHRAYLVHRAMQRYDGFAAAAALVVPDIAPGK